MPGGTVVSGAATAAPPPAPTTTVPTRPTGGRINAGSPSTGKAGHSGPPMLYRQRAIDPGTEPAIVTVTFHEVNGNTNVTTTIRFATKADRDAAFATGMTDGMEFSYKRLDGVLGQM